MIIAGLTGSIAMGKSETAKMFRKLGCPVFDADAAVHAMYAKGGEAVQPVGQVFPEAIVEGTVDRSKLSVAVIGKPDAMLQLEQIVHPLVSARRQAFLDDAAAKGHSLVILDIPLLFETGRACELDKVIVVSAPAEVQRERVLARPGMTGEKFEAILAKQVPDEEKRQMADFIVDTGVSLEETFEQVAAIVAKLRKS